MSAAARERDAEEGYGETAGPIAEAAIVRYMRTFATGFVLRSRSRLS